MLQKLLKKISLSFITITALLLAFSSQQTFAASNFGVSPMYQMITLTPGETYVGNFSIVNPGDNTTSFEYNLRIEPFSTDNDDEISLTQNGDYNQIVDWIELPTQSGSVAPNEVQEIRFTINVPQNAAAGGQYASIVVASAPQKVDNQNINLSEIYESAHLIYADIAGETIRKGEINDVYVPSFLFSGKIAGSSRIKNLGNVHSQVTSTMQIFPLFSNEEIFTNEEKPKKSWIMPGNTTLSSISWDETPSVGIFHVIYNVEYEGVESKVDKIVIVCPLWLLFLILLALFLLIFRILSAKKKSQK